MTTKGRYDSARQWRSACRNLEVAKDLHLVSAIRFIEEWVKGVIYKDEEMALRNDLDSMLGQLERHGLGTHELPDLFDAFGVKLGDFDQLLAGIKREVKLPDGLELVFVNYSGITEHPSKGLMVARTHAMV